MNKGGGGGGQQQQFLNLPKSIWIKKRRSALKNRIQIMCPWTWWRSDTVTSQIKNQILKTEACGHLIEKLNLHYRLPNMISHLFCIPQDGTDNTEVDNAHVSTCSRFSPWLQGHVIQHISCTNHARCPRWYLNTRKTDLNTRKMIWTPGRRIWTPGIPPSRRLFSGCIQTFQRVSVFFISLG